MRLTGIIFFGIIGLFLAIIGNYVLGILFIILGVLIYNNTFNFIDCVLFLVISIFLLIFIDLPLWACYIIYLLLAPVFIFPRITIFASSIIEVLFPFISIAMHIFTVVFVFMHSEWWKAILTAFLPGIAQAYWLIIEWQNTGFRESNYIAVLLWYTFCLMLKYILLLYLLNYKYKARSEKEEMEKSIYSKDNKSTNYLDKTIPWLGGTYSGSLEDNKPHGYGKLIMPNGAEYIGSWKEGKASGEGKIYYTNGRIYEGEIKNGKRHGQGVFIYPDGRILKGEWDNGKLIKYSIKTESENDEESVREDLRYPNKKERFNNKKPVEQTEPKKPFVIILTAVAMIIFALYQFSEFLSELSNPITLPFIIFLTLLFFTLFAFAGIGLLLKLRVAYIISIITISIFFLFSLIYSLTFHPVMIPFTLITGCLLIFLLTRSSREYYKKAVVKK